jgi:hypothetical protein
MTQGAVSRLCGLVPKLADDLEPEQLAAAMQLLDNLVHPLSSDDIRALMGLLPAEGDLAYGLNWTILHAIEASPDWPLWDTLTDGNSEWVRVFLLRLANDGSLPPWEEGSGELPMAMKTSLVKAS